MDKTIEYYNLYAEDYVNTTQSVDFRLIQERFLSALKAAFPKVCKKDIRILDLGCGSGRDSRYFLGQGYDISALSGSQLQSFRKCNEIAATVRLPYTFVIRKGLETSILLDDAWSRMFADQCEILLGWIRYQKVRYLQNRNPGVPGIIYKLEPENAGIRKLQNARKLWTMVMDRREILDIYNGQRLNDIGFDLDHFVPWSYVASDELWDLLPMDSSLNSSKSNRLPVWDQYFRNYAENQFRMYETVFTDASVRSQFEKCRKDNLTSIWGAEELYIPNHNQTEFMNILEKNLRPVYDAAKQQGYGLWKRMNAYSAAIQSATGCL